MRELVIKIPEELYKNIQNKSTEIQAEGYTVENAILNGTLLPKGHGRIGDLDKLIEAMKERDKDNGGEPLNTVDRGYHLAYEHLCEEIDNLLKENKNSNWIKCSDRLPDLDVEVLGTRKEQGDVVMVARWESCFEERGWEWILTDDAEGNSYKPDEIIAWMPVPEGFKEESNERLHDGN